MNYTTQDIKNYPNFSVNVKTPKDKVSILLLDKKFVERNFDNNLILGFVNINECCIGRARNSITVHTLQETDVYFCMTTDKTIPKLTKHIMGYFKTETGKYVAALRPNYLFLLLVFWLVVTSIALSVHYPVLPDIVPSNRKVANTIDTDSIAKPDAPVSLDTVKFAGYERVIKVNEKYPTIYLSNPADNDVYLTYTIVDADTDDIILNETDLIPPGKSLPFDAYTCIATDTDLYLVEQAYEMDEQNTKCSASRVLISLVVE